MPCGSWRGLGVPRQVAIGGSSSSFLPPGVVCGWPGAVAQPGRAVSPSLLGHCPWPGWSLVWGSRGPLCPAQPSGQAPTAVPSAPGGAQRRSGSGVTLLSCFSAVSGAVLPCTRVQLRLCAAGLGLIQQLWGRVLGGRAVPILQPQPSPATPCRAAQGSSREHRRRLGHGHVAGDAFAMSL